MICHLRRKIVDANLTNGSQVPNSEAQVAHLSVFFGENNLSRPKGSGLVTKLAAPINFVLAPCE
jgi:hypothetical protein